MELTVIDCENGYIVMESTRDQPFNQPTIFGKKWVALNANGLGNLITELAQKHKEMTEDPTEDKTNTP